MARHEIIIHENTSATSAVAPYLGNYIAKETLAMAACAAAIGAKCGLPAIQALAILGGSFEAIEALEREGLVRVHTDIGVICAVIKGSFPTADAAFDPARNSLELALHLDDAIQFDLANTVPVIVTDESVTKLRVDNVMDLVEERPMNIIHGQRVFRVAGFNMVLTDEGAEAYLKNDKGVMFPLVIDEVVSKQLFKAHTAELLPAGDYKLVVKSRAGDAGGPLQTSFRRVKYMHTTDPGPVPIAQTTDGKCKVMTFEDGEETVTFGVDWNMTGSGLFGSNAPSGDWSFDSAWVHVGAEDAYFQGTWNEDATEATMSPRQGESLTSGTYDDVLFHYTVVRDGITETLDIPIARMVVP